MARSVYLLAGPPCAGKTTLAHAMADGHEVVDYDAIIGTHGVFDPTVCDRVDEAIERIASDPEARAIVIRTAPDGYARQALTDRLGATCILLDPGRSECERRAVQDQRPSGTRRAIGMWYWKYTPADCDEI